MGAALPPGYVAPTTPKEPLGRPAGLDYAEEQGYNRRGSINRPPPAGQKPSRYRASILGGEHFKDPNMEGATLRTTKNEFKRMVTSPVASKERGSLPASKEKAAAFGSSKTLTAGGLGGVVANSSKTIGLDDIRDNKLRSASRLHARAHSSQLGQPLG